MQSVKLFFSETLHKNNKYVTFDLNNRHKRKSIILYIDYLSG